MNDLESSSVHQLLLGLKDGEGVAIIMHSMTSRDEALSWQRRLEEHARLQPWEAESTLPGKALSYYRFGGQAVVLRRWATGGNLGRNDAHALVGPIGMLTVPVALGLDSALNWQRAADTARSPLPGRELVDLGQKAAAELRKKATHQPEMLRRALGRLLDAPAKPLTILGCPDDHRVALIWALAHIGGEYLAKTNNIRRNWTFSTYEVDDADSILNLPEILFMPGIPAGGVVASRYVVDVDRDQPVSSDAERESRLLVQRFMSDEPLVPELDYSPCVPAAEAAPISKDRTSEPSVHDHRQGQFADSRPTRNPISQRPGLQRLERELSKLFSAEEKNLFKCQLDAFGKEFAGERAEIRSRLSVDDYLQLVFQIMRWDPPVKEMLELFQSLRAATFGPDGCDLSDTNVARYAIRLVAHKNSPDLFVRSLVQEIDKQDQEDLVAPAIAVRWRGQIDPAGDLVGVSPGRRRPLRSARGDLRAAGLSIPAGRRWLPAAAGIALLGSLSFVAITYSIGSETPSSDEKNLRPPVPVTPSATNGVNSSGVSDGGAKHEIVIRNSGQVPDGNMAVFVLFQTTDETKAAYPQVKCNVESKSKTLSCERFSLPAPAPIKPPFEVLVVKVKPEDKDRYEQAERNKQKLEEQPDPNDVILTESVLP